MNFKLVIRTISIFVIAIAIVMILPMICGLIYGEKEWASFLMSSLIALAAGGVGYLSYRHEDHPILRREGFAIVGLGWLVGSIFGSFPYLLSGGLNEIDALFETISGFTTTGATIYTDLEVLPKCILFWRSLTNWLGGMGIVVLFVAIFPFLGLGGKALFRSESSASASDGIRPKIRETSQMLWITYLGITLLEILLLKWGGVSFFDSLCHTFSTVATGGFSTYNNSIGHFNSAYVDSVVTLFMLLSGINFFVLYHLFTGQIQKSQGFSELFTYLGIVAFAFLLIVSGLFLADFENASLLTLSRQSLFQVVSIMTTTGFVTTDFEAWPSFCKVVLVGLMFIGGCAGSTGGGMKVIRFMIALKFTFNQILKTIHFGAVKSIKISDRPVVDEHRDEVLGFFILSFFCIIFFSAVMAATGLDVLTATTSVIAALWNIGPGLAKVGAVENYAFISGFGKIVLSLCMILGRLEFFAIVVLFVPTFWKK